MRMTRDVAPVAGMRSLPVMNESKRRWSRADARSNVAQNQRSVGSVSGENVAAVAGSEEAVGVAELELGMKVGVKGGAAAAAAAGSPLLDLDLALFGFFGGMFGQFVYSATARSDSMSSGSSEPRTRSSISSGMNSESALPAHTVKKPRLNGSNCLLTDTSSR